jgi:hypothetical protein
MVPLSDLQAAFMKPRRISTITDWLGHTPFAFVVVQWHAPSVLVELGTRTGVSYSAFCQAVQHFGLPTHCYAVDTWKGDDHSGFYEEDLFREFNEYHEANYKGFSSLMRMTFDEALDYFSDGSVDLLHIDGLHFYESCKHDFETWLPKMSDRGVILLHDTATRRDGFGVWRLLDEIRQKYSAFEFFHASGLGVVALNVSTIDTRLASLLRASDEELVSIRQFFSSLGEGLMNEEELRSIISRMENSWSWRLTLPMRRLYDRFHA